MFKRKPRRSRGEDPVPDEKTSVPDSKSSSGVSGDDMNTAMGPGGKPRRRRAEDDGGWMNTSSADPKRPISEPEPVPEEDDATNMTSQNKDKHFKDTNNDEILIIPDLDEDGGDNDQRVAHAPRNFNRRIPTLDELENDVKVALPQSETGLDMTVLFKSLVPAPQVQEEDVPWNFDTLLREVTEEIMAPVLSDLTITAPKSSSKLAGKDGEKKTKKKLKM